MYGKQTYNPTPLLLHLSGRSWVKLYESGIKASSTIDKIAAIYCLFIGLEMYLKAYISFLDKSLSSEPALKDLNHNLNSLYSKIVELGDKEVSKQLKLLMKKYNLFITNFNELRYAIPFKVITLDSDLEGDHGFDKIFKFIEGRIQMKQFQH